jgi:hypothetical protein
MVALQRKNNVAASSPRDVFINCPFDSEFEPGFRALVFAVAACGFRVRCAKEMDDATETRIDKLYRIIEQSRFGIHDLSRTELDQTNRLPRFNMPLELGLFLGAKRFGDDEQRKKRAIVMDTEQYRFGKFISDLAGMDITPHGGDARTMVECARNWLVTVSQRRRIPPTAQLMDSYDRFMAGLAMIARGAGLNPAALAYPDFERLVLAWMKEERAAGSL